MSRKPAILGLACAGTLLAFRLAAAAPVIHCAEPALDFGEQGVERPVHHVFTLENRGDADLVISEVRPGCASCTVARAEPPVVPPGGTSRIAVTLQLGGFRGAVTKPVYVHSNDPATPRLQLTLRGTAVTEIELTPASLSFPAIPVGGAVTGTVTLAATGTNRVSIVRLAPADTFLTATTRVLEEGRRHAITVVVRGDPPPDQSARPGGLAQVLEGSVVAHLDHPRQKAVAFSVRGLLREKVHVAPNLLPVAASAVPGAQRHLTLSFDPRPDFRVTAVEWPEGSVDFAWKPMGEGRGRLTLSNFIVKPSFQGREVVIRTTMPGKEELRVPIHVYQTPSPANTRTVPAP